MTIVWAALAWLGTVPVLVWTLLLTVEFFSALLPSKPSRCPSRGVRPTVGVLVPAHNEASVIGRTLDSLRPQLVPGDTLTVIAHNCSDDTPGVARAHGAHVVERIDPDRPGKGFALDSGIRHLTGDPPQVVVIVDADTPAQSGAVEALAVMAHACGRPVQASYLLVPPPDSQDYHRITAFAILVKNLVRPAGLDRIGLPCVLTGSGVALPWSVICLAELANGSLAEDLLMTAQLVLGGHAPRFCAEARIEGALPHNAAAAKTQRTRWEHGHLQVLISQVPRLMLSAVRNRRLDLLALALDIAIPPLSLLTLVWTSGMAFAVLAGLAGASWIPALLMVTGAALCALGVLGVWKRWGRTLLPLQSALSLPRFVLAKLPLYVAFVTRRQTTWVRTGRDPDDPANSPPLSGKANPAP